MQTDRKRRAARRGNGSPGRSAGRCPLALWRSREPARIGAGDVADLARAVAATAIPRERRWAAAKGGDAAASAAVAIDRLVRHGPVGPLADAVMGNLVLLARRDGDATAPVILAHALRSLSRREGAGSRLSGLADAWSRPSRRTRSRAARGRRA